MGRGSAAIVAHLLAGAVRLRSAFSEAEAEAEAETETATLFVWNAPPHRPRGRATPKCPAAVELVGDASHQTCSSTVGRGSRVRRDHAVVRGGSVVAVTGTDLLLLGFGVFLLVSVVVDMFWTTLWSDGGAGPLSSRLTSATWYGLRAVGGRRSRLLSLAGPLALGLTLAMWIGLIWAGWSFVFASGDPALVDNRQNGPISWTARTYFVAYTMFTMGNGDFTPVDGVWQLVTSVTTASGMTLVTLGASYVLSVLGAVVDKRSFASTVTGIGNRSEAFVRSGWDGDDLHELDLPLDTLSSELSTLAKQHEAYPILHYYHSEGQRDSSAVAVAVFDEALTLLRFGVPRPTGRTDP